MILIPVNHQTLGLIETLHDGVRPTIEEEPTCFVFNTSSGFTGIVSSETAAVLEGRRTEITIEHLDES